MTFLPFFFQGFYNVINYQKRNLIIAFFFFLINVYPIKIVNAQKKNQSPEKKNKKLINNSKKTKELYVGAEKSYNEKWIYKKSDFKKILKVQMKNSNYYKKKKKAFLVKKNFKNSFFPLPYFIEKINESEKLNSKKSTLNSFNLRLSGIQMLRLEKNFDKPFNTFLINQENYSFLKFRNKFSTFNPDLQLSFLVFSSFPAVKKIIEVFHPIPSDHLKSFLYQTFSFRSGSTFLKNVLLNNSPIVAQKDVEILKEAVAIEKKKSLIFRKKSYRKKKNIKKKKNLLNFSKKLVYDNFSHFKKRRKVILLKIKTDKKKIKIMKKTEKKKKKVIQLIDKQKIIDLKKKENKSYFKFLKKKFESKKYLLHGFGKIKIKSLADLNYKIKIRKSFFRPFGSSHFKTSFSLSKIKNYVKFLSLIKKGKKKKISRNLRKRSKNSIKFKVQKILEIKKNRKSFPLRINSFSYFPKRFLGKKSQNKTRKKNHCINFIKKFRTIENKINGKIFFRNENLGSFEKFSKYREKRKYRNILHSKESFRFLEKKGMFHLGTLFLKGKSVPRSFFQTTQAFFRVAKIGYSKAHLNLGGFFFQGKGLKRNKKNSIQFLKSAGKRGEKKGFYDLAFILKKGVSSECDLSKSIFFYRKMNSIRKKKKMGLKGSKRFKKNKFLKVFNRFIQNSNEPGLLRCYINSMNAFKLSSFPILILEKVHFTNSLVNLLNRSANFSKFDTVLTLGEALLENKQFFLTSKSLDNLFNFYPKNNYKNNLCIKYQRNQLIAKFFLNGDKCFVSNQNIHSIFFKLSTSVLEKFFDIFFQLFKYVNSTSFELLYMIFLGFYFIIFPFF